MKPQRPTHGGSYHLQKDGSLKLIEGPESTRELFKHQLEKPAPAKPTKSEK